MTTAAIGYEPVYAWVKQVIGGGHRTVGRTVAWAVLCVVRAQRVTPAALARALPHEQAGSGRSRLRRVRRWWNGPALEQAEISPQLIRQALRVHPNSQSVVVAMDTTRVGPWEVWRAGIGVGGRTLPIGWAVIPYPWPKGRYRATTVALSTQLQAAFPPGVRWSVVAVYFTEFGSWPLLVILLLEFRSGHEEQCSHLTIQLAYHELLGERRRLFVVDLWVVAWLWHRQEATGQ